MPESLTLVYYNALKAVDAGTGYSTLPPNTITYTHDAAMTAAEAGEALKERAE